MQGEDLKRIRKAMGVTQSELASALGIRREYVGLMERGDAPVELRTHLAVLYLQEHPEVFTQGKNS